MKKLLSLLLAMFIMSSVFVSCDSKRDRDDDNDNDYYSDKNDGENPFFDKNDDDESNDASDDKNDTSDEIKEDKCDHNIDEDDWYVQTYATCTEEGLEVATCPSCENQIERVLQKVPHIPG